jgi:hypothetical protein
MACQLEVCRQAGPVDLLKCVEVGGFQTAKAETICLQNGRGVARGDCAHPTPLIPFLLLHYLPSTAIEMLRLPVR